MMQINSIISGQTYSAPNTNKAETKNTNSDVWTQRITALGVRHATMIADKYNRGDYSGMTSHLDEIQSVYRGFMESRGGVWQDFSKIPTLEEMRASAGKFVGNEHIKAFSKIYRGAVDSELNRLGVDQSKLEQYARDSGEFDTTA